MPADLGELQFRCDLRDGIMPDVCLTGRYEPQETALLQRSLQRGMTFVDVGANWGYFTLAAAHLVGPTGRVVSVEADPAACDALRANCHRNSLHWVAVLEMAASDRSGELWLQPYDAAASESGNYGLTATTTVIERAQPRRVTARALDDAIDELNIDRIDLLKMDIEGGEARALVGIGRRLRDHRVNQVLLEVHPRHLCDQGSSPEEVVAELRASGYRAWNIDHSVWATQQIAAGRIDVADVLSPLADASDLGPWPHLLWTLES